MCAFLTSVPPCRSYGKIVFSSNMIVGDTIIGTNLGSLHAGIWVSCCAVALCGAAESIRFSLPSSNARTKKFPLIWSYLIPPSLLVVAPLLCNRRRGIARCGAMGDTRAHVLFLLAILEITHGHGIACPPLLPFAAHRAAPLLNEGLECRATTRRKGGIKGFSGKTECDETAVLDALHLCPCGSLTRPLLRPCPAAYHHPCATTMGAL